MVMGRWAQFDVLVGWVRIDWLVQVSKEEFHERLAAAAEHAPQLFGLFKSAAAAKKAEQAAAVESEMERLRVEAQKCKKAKDDTMAAAHTQVGKLTAEMARLSGELKESNTRQQELHKQLRGQSDREEPVEGMQAEVAKLTTELAASQKNVNDSAERQQQLEAAQDVMTTEYEALEEEVQKLQTQLAVSELAKEATGAEDEVLRAEVVSDGASSSSDDDLETPTAAVYKARKDVL